MTFLLCLLAMAAGSAPNPVFQDFEAWLKDYVALHKKLEAALPKLPDKASPEEIDRSQGALGKRMAAARSDARPGEFFTPAVQDPSGTRGRPSTAARSPSACPS
jgi:hypothetical protein